MDDASGGDSSTSSVSFGPVRVREYERVIDSTNIYMGLALGWNYNEVGTVPLREKKTVSSSKAFQRRPAPPPDADDKSDGRCVLKRTNGSDRYGLLKRYGYAQRELKQATNEAAKYYKQRQREAERVAARDAARALVVADLYRTHRTNEPETGRRDGTHRQGRRLLRSMFG
jgi:hypothetical protein